MPYAEGRAPEPPPIPSGGATRPHGGRCEDLWRGVGLMLAATALFVVMSALVKAASEEVPAGEAVFFRSALAVPVILAWVRLEGLGARETLATSRPWGHVWRGVVGTAAMGLGFAGLALLPLYEVQAIGHAAPLLTVLLAVWLAGERVRAPRLLAVTLGLLGVLIVLWPRLGGASGPGAALGALLVLASAAGAALAQVQVRRLVETEDTATIVLWFSLTASALSLATAPLGWVWPTPAAAAMLVGAGLIGGVAQICLTASYRHADAGVVAPFSYASMLIALAVGFVAFDEAPRPSALLGAALIVAGGALVIWRERRLGIERARAKAVQPPPAG